jgi:hypothetical protein
LAAGLQKIGTQLEMSRSVPQIAANGELFITIYRAARVESCDASQIWSHGLLALCFVTLGREEIDWAGLRAAAVGLEVATGHLKAKVANNTERRHER